MRDPPWNTWRGGACPLQPGDMCEVETRTGDQYTSCTPDIYLWRRDTGHEHAEVVRYRTWDTPNEFYAYALQRDGYSVAAPARAVKLGDDYLYPPLPRDTRSLDLTDKPKLFSLQVVETDNPMPWNDKGVQELVRAGLTFTSRERAQEFLDAVANYAQTEIGGTS